jgi:hypothetical protein
MMSIAQQGGALWRDGSLRMNESAVILYTTGTYCMDSYRLLRDGSVGYVMGY